MLQNFCPAIGYTWIAFFEPSNLLDLSKNLDLASLDHFWVPYQLTFGRTHLSLPGGACAVKSIYGSEQNSKLCGNVNLLSEKITLAEK